MALPICTLAFVVHSPFSVSITALFLEYLLCEGWMPPAMSMLQTCMDTRFKGVSIGIFLFATTISGTVAVSFTAQMIKYFDAKDDPEKIGKIIGFSTTVPCFFAAICFYKAGVHYAKQKASMVTVVEDAMEKVSVY